LNGKEGILKAEGLRRAGKEALSFSDLLLISAFLRFREAFL
jgi:hypothetical protein